MADTVKEANTYVTRYGDLVITHTYRQLLDPLTGQVINKHRIHTTLSAQKWLTNEMVEEYKKWQESGFVTELPDFLHL